MKRRALFIDRDGTLTYPFHYPSQPEHLRLYEGIGPGLRALQGMDFCIVVITNQAGIARGYFTHTELLTLHRHLAEEMAQLGVRIDAIYHCPHHPEGNVAEFAISCACRKPQPGMLLQAAQDLDIDMSCSWFVGDILDDVEAGNRAGCRTLLVDLGTEHAPTQAVRQPSFVARDTRHALEIIKLVEQSAAAVDLLYQPSMWSVPFFPHDTQTKLGAHAWYPHTSSQLVPLAHSYAIEGLAASGGDSYAERS